jgi:hypothetical protein
MSAILKERKINEVMDYYFRAMIHLTAECQPF